MNPAVSSFLNASRWIAAILVMAGHIRNLILVEYTMVESKSHALQLLYFATGFGHEAVIVFFVISGFLVGGLTWQKWRQEGVNMRAFAVARINRVYTVLIPALALGVALDSIGLSVFNGSGLYTNAEHFHTGSIPDAVGTIDPTTVLGNLFMLQTIAVGTPGSNGPLWSLANEWWYYCTFACAGAAAYGKGRSRFGFALVAILLVTALPLKLTLWAFVWAIGLALPAWIKSTFWRPHPAFGLGLLALALVLSRQSHGVEITGIELWDAFLKDLALGLAYAVALASTSRIQSPLRFSRLHHWLAEFSFSTYLLHFPLMLFLVAAGFQLFGWGFKRQPDAWGLTYFVALCSFVYAVCYVISLVTERKTNPVRRWLSELGVRPSLERNQINSPVN
jgi:peptidoglycan/LPS O-acetylase OafA/YrhL